MTADPIILGSTPFLDAFIELTCISYFFWTGINLPNNRQLLVALDSLDVPHQFLHLLIFLTKALAATTALVFATIHCGKAIGIEINLFKARSRPALISNLVGESTRSTKRGPTQREKSAASTPSLILSWCYLWFITALLLVAISIVLPLATSSIINLFHGYTDELLQWHEPSGNAIASFAQIIPQFFTNIEDSIFSLLSFPPTLIVQIRLHREYMLRAILSISSGVYHLFPFSVFARIGQFFFFFDGKIIPFVPYSLHHTIGAFQFISRTLTYQELVEHGSRSLTLLLLITFGLFIATASTLIGPILKARLNNLGYSQIAYTIGFAFASFLNVSYTNAVIISLGRRFSPTLFEVALTKSSPKLGAQAALGISFLTFTLPIIGVMIRKGDHPTIDCEAYRPMSPIAENGDDDCSGLPNVSEEGEDEENEEDDEDQSEAENALDENKGCTSYNNDSSQSVIPEDYKSSSGIDTVEDRLSSNEPSESEIENRDPSMTAVRETKGIRGGPSVAPARRSHKRFMSRLAI